MFIYTCELCFLLKINMMTHLKWMIFQKNKLWLILLLCGRASRVWWPRANQAMPDNVWHILAQTGSLVSKGWLIEIIWLTEPKRAKESSGAQKHSWTWKKLKGLMGVENAHWGPFYSKNLIQRKVTKKSRCE